MTHRLPPTVPIRARQKSSGSGNGARSLYGSASSLPSSVSRTIAQSSCESAQSSRAERKNEPRSNGLHSSTAFSLLSAQNKEPVPFLCTSSFLYVRALLHAVIAAHKELRAVRARLHAAAVDRRHVEVVWLQAEAAGKHRTRRFVDKAGIARRHAHAAVADPAAVLRAGPCPLQQSRKCENKGSEFGDDADFTPYYGLGVIVIDACTAHSGMVRTRRSTRSASCFRTMRCCRIRFPFLRRRK